MDTVLLLEAPTSALWPDDPGSILLLEAEPSALVVSPDAGGGLILDGSADEAVLVPGTESVFMLAPGDQGPPGPSTSQPQIYLQDASPAPVPGYVLLHYQTGQFPGYADDVTLQVVVP